ncbi:MAG: short-chain dehydrogenase/reductase [Sphingomonas bacterium]|nr:short-chain dehydrogenase/reductase [Sphingomonas bacterium]
MTAPLAGKVALVTGASKGIGAGIARALAAAGAAVAVNYASSREGADRVVAEIEHNGGQAIAVRGDVSQRDDARRIVNAAVERFGALDILVNNAAYFAFAPIAEISEAEFHRHFDTNVLGAILITQAALDHLRRGSSIINISSGGIRTPTGNATLYSATKAAIVTMTEVWARELGSRQIRVNAIAPGTTQTEGNPIASLGEPMQTMILEKTALGRVGLPSDIAPAAVFLASDAGAWMTGETLHVSGGFR